MVGNADDPGTTVTYWEYPTSYQGAAFTSLTRLNDPALDASYKSLEIAVKRRLTKGWQAMTSYSITKIAEPPGISNPTLVQVTAHNGVSIALAVSFDTVSGKLPNVYFRIVIVFDRNGRSAGRQRTGD